MKKISIMILCMFVSALCYAKTEALTKKMDESINTSILQAMSFKLQEQNQEKNQEKSPSLQCKKLTAAEIKEILKIEGEFPVPMYQLEAKEFKPRTQYFLYTVNMCLGKMLLGELIANAKGQLISKISSPEARKIFSDGVSLQCLGSFMNGESVSFVLVPKSGAPCSTITIAPNPIEHTWSDGSYACLWMQDQDACNFVFTGKGFKPNEPLLVTSKSGDEQMQIPMQANSEGLLFSMILPAVVNKSGGQASLVIKRDKTDEEGKLTYFWGSEAKLKKTECDAKH